MANNSYDELDEEDTAPDGYDLDGDEDVDAGKDACGCKPPILLCALGCGCCCCLFIILVMVAALWGASYLTNKPVDFGWAEALTACDTYWCGPTSGALLTPQNGTRYRRWPETTPGVGYKTNASFDAVKCYSPQIFYDWEAFNLNAPWDRAYFPSRPDPEGKAATVELMAWVMKTPVKRAHLKPRIIVQHGIGSNQNNRFAQNVAYMLRSMGFDVLVPGFRNHGWSGKSPHDRTTWGWVYPLDLLGAWDYAVNDPDLEVFEDFLMTLFEPAVGGCTLEVTGRLDHQYSARF